MIKRLISTEELMSMGEVISIFFQSNFKYYANVSHLEEMHGGLYLHFNKDCPKSISSESLDEVILKSHILHPNLNIIEVSKFESSPDGKTYEWHFCPCGAYDFKRDQLKAYVIDEV